MGVLSDHRLKDVLPEFQSFLVEKELTHERYIPFYALRVSQFLSFANRSAENDIETLVQKFLDQLKARENVSEGLVRQAQDAIRLYLYHYEDGIRFRELRPGQTDKSALSGVADVLGEMKRLILCDTALLPIS
jgi:hypothetical protein